MGGRLRREAVAGIIGGMAQHHDGRHAERTARLDAIDDQTAADTTILMFGKHGHGRQGRAGQGVVLTREAQPREQDMADDGAVQNGDQLRQPIAARAQGVNKIGLLRRRERLQPMPAAVTA